MTGTDPEVSELARLAGSRSGQSGRRGEPGPEITHAGAATDEPGPWNVSIQYADTQPMTVEAPG